MRVDGCDCGDGMAPVEYLVPGKNVLADGDALARDLRNRGHRGEVCGCNDSLDIGMRLSPAGVDGLDASVRVGAAQHLAMKQAGEDHVGAIEGAAGHLVHAVVPHRARADDLVIFLWQHCHHGYHLILG